MHLQYIIYIALVENRIILAVSKLLQEDVWILFKGMLSILRKSLWGNVLKFCQDIENIK